MVDVVSAGVAGRTASSPPDAASGRDRFLDAVRAIATVRVIAWHALGFPIISYLVAAMPAMFFVSGSLFAVSALRRPAWRVVADRLRRMALPLWTFGAVVWAVMLATGPDDGVRIAWWRLVFWFFPLDDPPGNAWENGWLSSPLWFLRAMLWILLLAPLFFALMRRWPRRTLALGVALVLAVDRSQRSDGLAVSFAPSLWWKVGDLALYGTFFAAGIHHARGGFTAQRSRAVLVALVAAAAATAWALTNPLPLGVVNNAHPMHLFVGVAWLSVAFALRPTIVAMAHRRRVGAVIRFLSQRSMTIYLWHTTAVLGALRLLDAFDPSVATARWAAYAAIIAGGTVLATIAFGWAEDLSARRRPLWWAPAGSTRRANVASWCQIPLVLIVVAGVLAVETALPARDPDTVAAIRRPPVPSQRPPLPAYRSVDDNWLVGAPISRAEFPATLAALVDAWLPTTDMSAVNVGVRLRDGQDWVYAAGIRPDDGEAALAGDALDVQSVTKLFTTSLVLRAADRGLIDLHAPLPDVGVLDDVLRAGAITPLMLLTHRSGLVSYRDTPDYAADAASIDSPESAVRASAAVPLTMTPGERVEYSSTNYLVLGILLEQVTGRPFDGLFQRGVLQRLGITDAQHLASEPGEPRQGTAGLITTMPDLMRAAETVLTDGDGVSAALHELRMVPDPDTATGVGTFGYCPCFEAADGSKTFLGVGYTGGHTWVAYLPSLEVTIGMDIYDDLWRPGRFEALTELFEQVAKATGRIVE